ncbi:MAG: recombination mediator RecR [bacterium]
MKSFIPESIQTLIDEFAKLPGVGRKSASRLVFYLLNKPQSDLDVFSDALKELKVNLKKCQDCFNITENKELCSICSDRSRDHSQICIVENILDVIALENTSQFKGLYHVLGGSISPIEGIGPDELTISDLLKRIKKNSTTEAIIATNPSLEGDATAMYLQKVLSRFKDLKITRLALGLPVGGTLEYADEITLERALQGRVEYNKDREK